MARPRKGNRIDFTMSDETAARLAELENSMRAVGHSKPAVRTLISALIMAEPRRGDDLERDLLMPFLD